MFTIIMEVIWITQPRMDENHWFLEWWPKLTQISLFLLICFGLFMKVNLKVTLIEFAFTCLCIMIAGFENQIAIISMVLVLHFIIDNFVKTAHYSLFEIGFIFLISVYFFIATSHTYDIASL
jgi:hypothetical protein